MARAPGGTVTVLFTDIVGSTELLERLGDQEAERVRRAHFRLLRGAVARRGGQEVKTIGDGLMVVFSSTADALACAIGMQQGVHAHNEHGSDPALPLHVRIGLDVGEPIRHESDYFGMPVVVARRLCDSAQGGEIIASELVRTLVASRGDYVFRELGARALKGISEPVAACQLLWEPAGGARTEDVEAQGGSWLTTRLRGESTQFVGREPELEALRRSWDRALSGQRHLVTLAGEAGIGKTRLATEFALEAEGEGAQVLFGRTDEGTAVPGQPFVDAVRSAVAARLPAELQTQLGAAGAELMRQAANLADQLGDDALSRGEEGATARQEREALLSQTLSALLSDTLLPSPMLVVLDDLQWADKATLQLLKQVILHAHRSRLLVIATYRDTNVASGEPVAETLSDLRRDRLMERISLAGLSEEAVGSLVATWAGQDAPASLTEIIHELTEGNPLFVEEMLRHLTETGAMYDADGRLRHDLTRIGVPEGVKNLISRRLARLSESCNSVLTVASVIGRDFGLDTLERASDLPEAQLIDALEEAVHASLVREVPRAVGRYSFAHALIHETLYDELTSTRRVHLHGQTLQYADNDGVKLAYEVLGATGPHMIAIGLSNCPAVRTRNWTTARRWGRLTGRCRLILYDRRGVGCSSAPERGYSLFAGIEDIHAVLDAAGVERAILWGATDGGPLAVAFAVHYPERVAGLLLLGTTAKYTNDESFAWGVPQTAVESFMRTDAVDRGRAVSQLTETRAGRSVDAAGPDAIAEVMRRVPRRAWSKLVLGIGAADVRSLLPQVSTPTLIIHDPDNTYIPVEAAQFLHRQIAGSELLITEEWGRPLLGNRVYDAIEQFIEAVTGRPP